MEFPLALRTVGERRVATGAGFTAQLVEYFKYAVSTGLIIQHYISQAWMSTPVILVLGRGRQENCKFKVILSYVTSLWSAWATYGPVSKTRNIIIATLVAADAELYRGVCCTCT